jgi:hypothetical protein
MNEESKCSWSTSDHQDIDTDSVVDTSASLGLCSNISFAQDWCQIMIVLLYSFSILVRLQWTHWMLLRRLLRRLEVFLMNPYLLRHRVIHIVFLLLIG